LAMKPNGKATITTREIKLAIQWANSSRLAS
jgi:hypothetical protein